MTAQDKLQHPQGFELTVTATSGYHALAKLWALNPTWMWQEVTQRINSGPTTLLLFLLCGNYLPLHENQSIIPGRMVIHSDDCWFTVRGKPNDQIAPLRLDLVEL